jgi:hypothetical protein
MKRKIKNSFKMLLLCTITAFITLGFLGDDKSGVRSPKPIYKITGTQQSGKVGDAYGLYVNNIWMPLNRKGVIADVDIPPLGSQGQFAGSNFLFSSGFFLSGLRNGVMWSNAVASASLVEDYREGTVEFGSGDPRAVLYVLNANDEPFGDSWQDWRDAVALGADFYDGDGDGVYNPVDKNGNGKWDPDEDRPDIMGDETVWCVYNDAVPVAQRRWNTTLRVGVEVRQTVFAFASAGAIGNLVFVRYRITYVGVNPNDPEELTEVYFGAWADPDIGDATDDVVGVDTVRNAGYTYGNQPDAAYGSAVPCFMIDFFSGPVAYIPGETFVDVDGDGQFTEGVDTPLDTAYISRGQILGNDTLPGYRTSQFPGAKNLPISSFVMYINGDPDLRDPSLNEEARNYILGTNRVGAQPDPCEFPYGEVRGGVICEDVDPRFWFSGDPVTDVGWICTENQDMRQMTNTGPFTLRKGEENEIVLAYVVDRGSNPLDGITRARATDDGAQLIFDLNFLAPPAPPPADVTVTSSDDFIDIRWPTRDQVTFRAVQAAWDLRFHSYLVYAFRQNNTSDLINGQENAKLIASFQMDNFIENVFKENAATGGIELLYPATEKLDSVTYADEQRELRVRVYNDPFTGTPIVKGTPYYFAVVGTAVNYDAIVSMGADSGDYYISSAFFVQETENIRTINTIYAGNTNIDPSRPVDYLPTNKISGYAAGRVVYDIVNNEDLKESTYEVTFFKDNSSTLYDVFWKLENINTGVTLIDSSKDYIFNDPKWKIDAPITEGFITRVEPQSPAIGTPLYDTIDVTWFKRVDIEGTPLPAGSTYPRNLTYNHGVFYLGRDLAQGTTIAPFPGGRCDAIKATDLRRVELRFGTPGKAYRYINGYLGNALQQLTNYTYAERITAADTVGKGAIGNWDVNADRPNGYIDVPFTAWINDERTGDKDIQLAVGIIEARVSNVFPNGKPDGIWDPGDSVKASSEMIVIFNAPYDPDGSQIEYTGGDFNTPGGTVTVWSDLLGASPLAGDIPDDAIGITEEQKAIFSSAWFNAMYVIGLSRKDANSFFTEGEKLNIPISVYPYTENDVYQFTLSGSTVTEAFEREMWEKVNVYPNPLHGYNPLTSFETNTPDEPFVTFTNLPEEVTIKIYSLSGQLLRTLRTSDKSSPTSPFLRWNLLNESGLRVASGMYLAIVSSPKFGDKVLKIGIIMPQKQIQRF